MRCTARALWCLVKLPLILLFLLAINWMTFSGAWWVQWAALGLGIAWLLCLLHVLRTIILAGGIAAIGYLASRR